MAYTNSQNNPKKVIEEIKKIVIPSINEQKLVNSTALEILQIINEQANPIGAKLIIGGSVKKGTWLPGIHDIDCFLQFDYIKYKNKNEDLSNIAEKLLKKCFKNIKRLHGSRDYFQVEYNGFEIEIIPVINITKPELMLNITDVSPLHINWLAKKTKLKNLETDARLSKKFCRGIGVYGAESFIRGLSGHVIEVLTVHYGGFLPFIKAISKWDDRASIDPQGHYTDEKQMMLLMNSSKLVSNLIVVDPIQPERNAAAVLSDEKFQLLKNQANQFLKKPSKSFFIEKHITIEQIKARKTKNKLLLFTAEPEKDTTIDISGCQILKKFEYIERMLNEFDFKIKNQGWYWDKQNQAIFWFYIDPQILSQSFRHAGPPVKLDIHADSFKKQWNKFNVRTAGGKLYVDLPRKVRTIDDFLTELKKDPNLVGIKHVN